MATFVDQLFSIASENKISEVNSELFAKFMDSSDDLKDIRNEFIFPIINDRPSIYLCGNSLGLQPKGIRVELNKELDKWAREGVEGHFTGRFICKLLKLGLSLNIFLSQEKTVGLKKNLNSENQWLH